MTPPLDSCLRRNDEWVCEGLRRAIRESPLRGGAVFLSRGYPLAGAHFQEALAVFFWGAYEAGGDLV